MKIHYSLENFSAKNPVLTIGMFDGVHKGHKMILSYLDKAKKECNGESVLLTFWPHPQVFFGRTDGFSMLSTIEEKCYLLEQTGLDHCVILPFTQEFANLSPQDYITSILYEGIGVSKVFVGYDHRYGKLGAGNFALLQEYGQKLGFEVNEISAVEVGNVNVSSSKVRKAISSGELEKSYDYLGYHYSIKGRVIHGKKLGRTIGVPTANLKPKSEFKILPAKGVYVAQVEYEEKMYAAAVSVGLNPTIDDTNTKPTIEAHILDFNQDIYDRKIRIYFFAKIRDEKKYNNLDELQAAIALDIAYTRQYFDSKL